MEAIFRGLLGLQNKFYFGGFVIRRFFLFNLACSVVVSELWKSLVVDRCKKGIAGYTPTSLSNQARNDSRAVKFFVKRTEQCKFCHCGLDPQSPEKGLLTFF
ncbi:MAG: hypothetical protein LBN27_08110, partial [Prevotellaceae bacterium]|nr:hypothetical protein [Prevotellaceae bacterium]